MDVHEIIAYADEGELTPGFVKVVLGITFAFLVIGGVLAYIVTFVVLGF